jgi:hypothetical protein
MKWYVHTVSARKIIAASDTWNLAKHARAGGKMRVGVRDEERSFRLFADEVVPLLNGEERTLF